MEPIKGQDGDSGGVSHASENLINPVQPLRVVLRREPFDTVLTIKLPDGSSEELDPDQARSWFKLRGANMDVVEKTLDHLWNFYNAVLVIKNPKHIPIRVKPSDEPETIG